MDLKTFLLARIAEDEAVARDAIRDEGGHWYVDQSHDLSAPVVRGDIHIYDEGGHTAEQALHIARHDPARVLAECAAKRSIVEKWRDSDAIPTWKREETFFVYGIDLAVRALAAVYADHTDYQPEWKL